MVASYCPFDCWDWMFLSYVHRGGQCVFKIVWGFSRSSHCCSLKLASLMMLDNHEMSPLHLMNVAAPHMQNPSYQNEEEGRNAVLKLNKLCFCHSDGFANWDLWDGVVFALKQCGYIVHSVSVEFLDDNIREMQHKKHDFVSMVMQGTDYNKVRTISWLYLSILSGFLCTMCCHNAVLEWINECLEDHKGFYLVINLFIISFVYY